LIVAKLVWAMTGSAALRKRAARIRTPARSDADLAISPPHDQRPPSR
jgi:hypothetical protein